MNALETQMDDLTEIARRRMAEHAVMLQALRQISDIDPEGDDCKLRNRFGACGCIGCIARRGISGVEIK